MRVFVLSTGRCGSLTFTRACTHISNYTASHESLSDRLGSDRFKYPDNHIESDNRLSWQLGQLDNIYGDNAFYVHLKRGKVQVARSVMARFFTPYSIIDTFCGSIRMNPPEKMSKAQRLQACYDYIDTVNANIELFLSSKSKKMTIEIEQAKEGFPVFWKAIEGVGDIDAALAEFDQKYNTSQENLSRKMNPLWDIKLTLLRIWKRANT